MADNIRDVDLANVAALKISDWGSRVKSKKRGSYINLPESYPEATLFAMLMWKFGPPNGPMSLPLGPSGDPDAPWKWDYLFELPEGITIHIMRSWLNIEVRFSGGKVNRDDFLAFLGTNQKRYAKEIKKQLSELEQYVAVSQPLCTAQTSGRDRPGRTCQNQSK